MWTTHLEKLISIRPAIIAVVFVWLACEPKDRDNPRFNSDDEGDLLGLDPDTGNTSSGDVLADCDELITKINGESAEETENPMVGDEWMIRMFCDDALLMGANRLFFQPASVAFVDEVNTDARFVAPGPTTMTMQAGSFIYKKEITVLGAE